jgi:hypothetical protein
MPGSAYPGSGSGNQSQPNDFGSEEATRNAKVSDAGPQGSRGPNAGSRPDFERGQERTAADDTPGGEQRSFETPGAAQSDDPPEDRYDPDPAQVTRGRGQGLGMGERDLERQRDPHRPVPPADEENRPDGE